MQMRIAAAQIKSKKGDLDFNIERHIRLAQIASDRLVNLMVFPELSLIAYEPSIAEAYAVTIDDIRMDALASAASTFELILSAGIPVKSSQGIHIGMMSFFPDGSRQIYTKAHLHEDELPFFVAGDGGQDLMCHDFRIAPSICYELSIEDHVQQANKRGAHVYLSSVAKHQQGVESASSILSSYAKQYSMSVMMANAIGENDDYISKGQSSVWDSQGTLMRQMDSEKEGLLLWNAQEENTDILYF